MASWAYEACVWLAADPARYRGLVYLALLFLIGWVGLWAFRDARAGSAGPQSVGWSGLALCLAFLLLSGRWPVFFNGDPLNIDESQMIAGALTLLHHPLFFASVDGTTTGPLNDYILLLPSLLGGAPSFLSARFVAVLLLVLSFICVYGVFRLHFSASLSALAILPAVLFFALASHWDFVHYTSEHMPVFLISAGAFASFYGMLAAGAGCRKRLAALFVAGLLYGSAPYAKIQSLPMALWGFCFLLAWVVLEKEKTRGATRYEAFALLLGGGAFTALTCAAMLAAGAFYDFYQSYIVNNLFYARERFAQASLLSMIFDSGIQDWDWFFRWVSAFLLLASPAVFFLNASERRCVLFFAGWSGSVFLAYVATGRFLPHYLLFLAIPWAALAGALLAGALGAWQGRLKDKRRFSSLLAALFLALYLGLCLTPQVLAWAKRDNPFLAGVQRYPFINRNLVAEAALAFALPGESMAVWGWMPLFYVQTGLHQATREGQTERQIKPGPQQEYYRRRYLLDLAAARPPVFLDAVGPGNFEYQDRSAYGVETFPELAIFIGEQYSLVTDVLGVRVFIRKDRL